MRLREKGWLWYHAFDNNFWLQWTFRLFLPLAYLSSIINIYICWFIFLDWNFLKNLILTSGNLANEVITKLFAFTLPSIIATISTISTDNSNLKLNRSNSLENCIPRRCSFSLRETKKFFAESLLAMKFVWCQERVMTCLFSLAQFMRSVDGNQCDEW